MTTMTRMTRNLEKILTRMMETYLSVMAPEKTESGLVLCNVKGLHQARTRICHVQFPNLLFSYKWNIARNERCGV